MNDATIDTHKVIRGSKHNWGKQGTGEQDLENNKGE